MDRLSDGTETWLTLLVGDFACELANQAIQSEHVRYASSADTLQAMVRTAYLKGQRDALTRAPDFDADVRAVALANAQSLPPWDEGP